MFLLERPIGFKPLTLSWSPQAAHVILLQPLVLGSAQFGVVVV